MHALEQVAPLKAKKSIPPLAIEHGLNGRLPFDVNILEVQAPPPGFHNRHDALSRTYHLSQARPCDSNQGLVPAPPTAAKKGTVAGFPSTRETLQGGAV